MAIDTLNISNSPLNPKGWKKSAWVAKLKEELKNSAPPDTCAGPLDPEKYEGACPSQDAVPVHTEEIQSEEAGPKDTRTDKEKIREDLLKLKNALHIKSKKTDKPSDCPPPPAKDLIEDFENNELKTSRSNLELLKDQIDTLPDSDPDKAFLIAREALILARTGKDRKIDEAKELLAKAKEMNPADHRIPMLEAGLHVMLGKYEDALKIYKAEIKEAKKSGDACTLQSLSYELISLNILLQNEISNAGIEQKREALKAGFQLLKFALNPLSIVDLAAGELIHDAIYYDRPEYKEKDLQGLKADAEGLAAEALQGLADTGDPKSLIILGNTILNEYRSVNENLNNVTKMSEAERAQKNLPLDDEALKRTRGSYSALLGYFYPLIASNAIKCAKDNKDFAALAAIGDNLFSIGITIPALSSSLTALRGTYSGLAEKAFEGATQLTEDREALSTIGKQLFVLGKYDAGLKALKKMAALDEKPPLSLGYAYVAAGQIDEAKKFFGASSQEELKILESGKFDDIEIRGVDLGASDALKVRALVKLMEGNPMALAMSVSEFFCQGGKRVGVSASGDGNKIYIDIKELKIKEMKVAKGKKNKDLASWFNHFGYGELAPGKPFNVNELTASLTRTSNRIGTFSPSPSDWDWQIVEEAGEATVYVDINETPRKFVEFGAITSTSGKDDLLGMTNLMWRFPSGKDISLNLSAGKMNGQDVVNGTASYYVPDAFKIKDKIFYSEVSVFRDNFINWAKDRNDLMTGAGLKIGTDVAKNTNAWIKVSDYALQNGGIQNVSTLYAGATYDSRIENRGTFFEIYGGPGLDGNGSFFKLKASAMQYFPLPKGGTFVLKGIVGTGSGLPASERYTLGKNISEFKGLLDNPQIGNMLLIGGGELRSKPIKLGKSVKIQPYVFLEAGAAIDIKKMGPLKFIPWYGLGTRVYSPITGWIDLFYGWPIGTVGTPQFGFDFEQERP